MATNPIAGTFGTSVEDRVRMIERNKDTLTMGELVWVVTFNRYDPLYDRLTEMSTLPTHDKAKAAAQYRTRSSNPHYSNVQMYSYIYRGV